MSNDALSWAFALRMTDASAKAVLIALANHADEEGKCWPSNARICLHTSLSERTVRTAQHRLAEMGAVRFVDRPGTTQIAFLNLAWTGQEPRQQLPPCNTSTPAAVAPLPRQQLPPTPANAAPTPAAVAPEPSRTLKEPSVEPSIGEAPGNARPSRASRLSPDWRPDASERAYAAERGLDPDSTAEDFRDYWIGRGGLMADWRRTWQRWCRSPFNQPKHHARNGQGNRSGRTSIVAGVAQLLDALPDDEPFRT